MTPFDISSDGIRMMTCSHPTWVYAPESSWVTTTFGDTTVFIREMSCFDCKAMSLLGPLVIVDEEDEQ